MALCVSLFRQKSLCVCSLGYIVGASPLCVRSFGNTVGASLSPLVCVCSLGYIVGATPPPLYVLWWKATFGGRRPSGDLACGLLRFAAFLII